VGPLVLGAGGFLGINLVDALAREGVVPRCGRRRRSNVLALRSRKVPLVPADLDSPEELEAAMRGCDVVYHLAGHYPRLSTAPHVALALGLTQSRAVIEAAVRAGVKRLVYASTTATVAPAPEGPSDESHVFTAAPRLGTYHDLKWAMEEMFLTERRLEVVVACPSGCLGPYDLRVGTSAIVVALANGMDPPHPDGIANLVDVRDVATALVRLGHHPSPPRRVIISAASVGLHSFLCDLADRYGVAPPSAPMRAEEALRYSDEEELRVEREGGRPGLSREIADLVVHGTPLSTRLAETTLGMRWTPLEDTLDALDEWARRMGFVPQTTTVEKHS
jgi:nucleoside-diphosphate-sugar epimerase